MVNSELTKKLTAPIIDSLKERFSSLNLSYSNRTDFFQTYGDGGYYTTFHVAHPEVQYNPEELTKWSSNLLQDFELDLTPARSLEYDGKLWLYYPQFERKGLVYAEKEINRRLSVNVADNRFTVEPLEDSMTSILNKSPEGVIITVESEFYHHLSIIAYPEKAILQKVMEGKIGARNFVAPSEIARYTSSPSLAFK